MGTRRRRGTALVAALFLLLAGAARALQEMEGLLSGSDRPTALSSAFDSDFLGRFPQLEVLLAKGDAALAAGRFRDAAAAYEEARTLLLGAPQVPAAAMDRVRLTLVLTYLALGKPRQTLDHAQDLVRARRTRDPADPVALAEGYRLLATVHLARLRPLEAAGPADNAVRLCRQHLGPGHADTARSELVRAAVLFLSGSFAKARELSESAIRTLEQALGEDSADLGFLLPLRAAIQLFDDDLDDARATIERALRLQQQHLGEESPYLVGTLKLLAGLYLAQDKVGLGVATLEKALRISQAAFGEDHIFNAGVLDALADVEARRLRFKESYQYVTRGLAMRTRLFGEGAPETGLSRMRLAGLIGALGRRREALEMALEAARLNQLAFGSEHPIMSVNWLQVAAAYWGAGDYQKARRFSRRSEDQLARKIGATNPLLAGVRIQRGALELLWGDPAQGLEYFDQVRPLLEKNKGKRPLGFGLLECLRGRALLDLDRLDEAAEALTQGAALMDAHLEETRFVMILAYTPQAELAARRGDVPEAHRLYLLAKPLVETLPPTWIDWMDLDRVEFHAAMARKAPEAALRVAAKLLERTRHSFGARHPEQVRGLRLRARAERACGTREAALGTLDEALALATAGLPGDALELQRCRQDRAALAEKEDP